jgi:uncharacterized protein YegP (UPF0339 family)
VKARFEVYEDAAGEFRWRLVAGNGEIVADSAEGYTRWEDAERAVETVRELVPTANLESE